MSRLSRSFSLPVGLKARRPPNISEEEMRARNIQQDRRAALKGNSRRAPKPTLARVKFVED